MAETQEAAREADNVSGKPEHNEPVTETPGNENANDERETGNRRTTENSGEDAALGAAARGLFGYSKLHAAASNGQHESLGSLLEDSTNISDINGRTVDGGYTPLHLAASAGHDRCVAELLNCDEADIHVTDAFGRTPLETAEQNFKNDVAKLLRSHGKSSCDNTIIIVNIIVIMI